MRISTEPRFSVAHEGVDRSLRFIFDNCCRPIDVRDVLKLTGLSRRGFQKAFRKHTGLQPGQLLRRLRIEQAKRLLTEHTEHDLDLNELAARCGYRKVNSFWVAFRHSTGLAPGEYRRRARLAEGL